MTLRQRQPREKDGKHLDFIRSLPCCICGGIDTEAHHPRPASLENGKDHTGMGEKASDKWAIPVCNRHHRELHGFGDELAWWKIQGINPFILAMTLRRT